MYDKKATRRKWYKENIEHVREYAKAYRAANKSRIAAWKKKYAETHVRVYKPRPPEQRQKFLEKQKLWRLATRLRVIDNYSKGKRRCNCCGEKDIRFLSIDHINNGGNKHKREIGTRSSSQLCAWLVKNGFPEGFQILCFNCNCGKGIHGVCPHKLQNTK